MEDEEHKKRMKELKKKKVKKGTKKAGGKNRFTKNMNSAFFNNSKQNKDEVAGWAFDFEKEDQVMVPPHVDLPPQPDQPMPAPAEES